MAGGLIQDALAVGCGLFVGFALGLFGGGGSILAVPLLVYVVGVSSPHVAIGTSATAVALSAAIGIASPVRRRLVKWRCALVFAAAGAAGALMGSALGKAIDGERLLGLFAVLMIGVAALMLAKRNAIGDPGVRLAWGNLPKLLGFGFATGALSGFFGIGGGFLIVPALIAATGMPILNAVSSSLVAVAALGVTTAANYQLSGPVDWRLALFFVAGGLLGGAVGAPAARLLSSRRGALNNVFASLIILVAAYMLARGSGLA